LVRNPALSLVSIALPALVFLVADAAPAVCGQERPQATEQTQRLEGDAVLALADAALAGKSVPSDFQVGWQNEFLKAQRGTFVPFTLTIDASRLTRRSALIYVRAVPGGRDRRSEDKKGSNPQAADDFPVDAIFPTELSPDAAQRARVSRGFSHHLGSTTCM
jgi:hypothetical protein